MGWKIKRKKRTALKLISSFRKMNKMKPVVEIIGKIPKKKLYTIWEGKDVTLSEFGAQEDGEEYF
jgi:hypothetical protein